MSKDIALIGAGQPALKQTSVSGSLPSNAEMDLLLNKLLAEMRHQDPHLAYRPTEEQMEKLRKEVWLWCYSRRQ